MDRQDQEFSGLERAIVCLGSGLAQIASLKTMSQVIVAGQDME